MLAQVQTPPVVIPSFTIPGIVVTIIIAALCGAIAQLIVGYTRGGCLGAMLIGLVGALVGNWIARALLLPNILIIGGLDVIWTVIGAAVFVAALSLIMGGGRWRGYYRRRYP